MVDAPAVTGVMGTNLRRLWMIVITVLLIVTAPAPAFELVATTPPPSPSSVLLLEISEFVTDKVPVPLASQSNPPPKPSPANGLGFRPKRIVTPEILVANADVKAGLIDNTLSIPLDVVVPACKIVLSEPLPVMVVA